MDIEDHLEGLAIPDDEEEGVALENDEEVFLPGKIDQFSQRTINFKAMKMHMSAIWKPEDGVHIKDIANQRFLFHFFHEADVRMVLDGRPWTFDNNLLILARLNQGLIGSQKRSFNSHQYMG